MALGKMEKNKVGMWLSQVVCPRDSCVKH